jgi:hypothetical protein
MDIQSHARNTSIKSKEFEEEKNKTKQKLQLCTINREPSSKNT